MVHQINTGLASLQAPLFFVYFRQDIRQHLISLRSLKTKQPLYFWSVSTLTSMQWCSISPCDDWWGICLRDTVLDLIFLFYHDAPPSKKQNPSRTKWTIKTKLLAHHWASHQSSDSNKRFHFAHPSYFLTVEAGVVTVAGTEAPLGLHLPPLWCLPTPPVNVEPFGQAIADTDAQPNATAKMTEIIFFMIDP